MKQLKLVLSVLLFAACIVSIWLLHHLVTDPMAFTTQRQELQVDALQHAILPLEKGQSIDGVGELRPVPSATPPRRSVPRLPKPVLTAPELECGPPRPLEQGGGSVRYCEPKR